MILSEKDFLNYIRCPLYYKFESNGQNLQRVTFNSLLHDIANQYIRRVSSIKYLGNFDHENFIKKLWDKAGLENQHIITPKQQIQGFGYLFQLMVLLRDTGVEVLDTDPEFPVTTITANGTFAINGRDSGVKVPEETKFGRGFVTDSKW